MKKLKGIILVVFLSIASIMMPFNVYASVQSQIVPTFSSSTSQWNGHLWVTNFSDGTNNQASSTLQFTLDDDYYGMIYFDGYGPSNQHIANYAVCFIAAGQGEYRYSYYQNGVINITQVTIQAVSVVKPGASVDLSQIVTLLTAIESDTTAIDNILDSTLIEIRSVLAELIVSNNYLEIISELRHYDIPFESFPYIALCARKYEVFNYMSDEYLYYSLPLFKATRDNTNGELFNYYVSKSKSEYINVYYLISYRTSSGASPSLATTSTSSLIQNTEVQFFTFPNGYGGYLSLMKRKYYLNNSGYFVLYTNSTSDFLFCPLYIEYDGVISNVSSDFALRLGLTNKLMYDLNIITNGTSQSSSAASDLENSNDQMASDMNDLANIESGYNQSFNDQMQLIDFSNPIQNNAGLLPAANFVINIFNGLISNNPLSVLIIVCCVLLIGKKVIGK